MWFGHISSQVTLVRKNDIPGKLKSSVPEFQSLITIFTVFSILKYNMFYNLFNISHLLTFKNSFKIVLHLQKFYEDSTEISHIPYTWFPLLLSYTGIVYLE